MNDHVLITGGSRGIGAATVLEFARAGYDVAFTWNSREDAALDVVQQAQALNPGGRFVALHADVSDSAQVNAAVQEALQQFGSLQALVCCAGIAQQKRQLITGTHSNPFIGEHIGASVARVDGHHIATVFANFLELLDLDRAHRFIAARVEQHDIFGVGRVEHRRRAQKGLVRSIDIGIGKRRVVIIVRRTDRSHEALRIPRIGCAAILEQRYLAARARNVAGDVRKSIVPAHLGKTAFAVSLHGLGHAIFGSRERRQALATAAHISTRMRMALGAHKAPQFSTAHPSFDAALIRTASAQSRFGVRNRGI